MSGDSDEADEPDYENLAASHYLLLGYSASASQIRLTPDTRRMRQASFRLITFPASPEVYAKEGLDREIHLGAVRKQVLDVDV